ncbi:MAG: AsmA family protein [Desulfobulbaceae bacterium]|nr:AsmA family protein [Desulfobulbaceae bacterium]
MSKPIKYLLITFASLGVLVVAAVLIITTLVDVESYKPKIEQLVTEKTGYPLTLGGEISLSLFPWVGLSFTDLQLDNPEGFVSKTFVRIDGFQARLKVLPLLSKKVEISSFVVNRPEISLEKGPSGNWNWEKLTEVGKPSTTPVAEKTTAPDGGEKKGLPSQESDGQGGFALESLTVGEFSITDGRVQLNDLENNLKHEVSDFTLQLVDVSLDKPIKITMAAVLDGKPLGVKGSVGPLGPDPVAGKINLDLVIQALETLNIQASGYLDDIKRKKEYKLAVNVEPFSPKQLFSNLDLSFPVTTTDPQVLGNVGFRADIVGDATQVVVSDSNVLLDDSSIKLDVTAKDFSRPDLAFNIEVDSIDIDRYLPPQAAASEHSKIGAGKEAVPPAASPAATSSGQAKQNKTIDYAPLRKLVLQGIVKLGQVKVHGGTINNFALNVAGRDGIFTVNSLGMDLYEGNIAATGKLNVQKDVPVTALNLTLKGVQVGPLLKDFTQKEIIEGMLKAEVAVNLRGDNGELIKRSLNGKGDLLFQDGALIGLDLAQMARNIKSGFTLEQQGERPKTDFAELHAPFSITNGLVNTSETNLQSPFVRVLATGNANLVSEVLDMRVKPTIVSSMKGQGDEEKRSGLTIPVLVSGTFKAPKFSPDLEGIVKDQIPSEKELSDIIKSGEVPEERKEQLEQAKGLLKGLFGK